jgi:outer membrane receptor protein involved in Fe transport
MVLVRGKLTRKRYVAVLAFLAAAGIASAGQDLPDLSEASLEQLGNIKVYGASKHLQEGADAPSSVTVINAEQIRQHGYRTLADVLQTVRGFFVTNDRNYSSLGVRGFARPGDYNTRILLLVDGHRINDNVYDEAMIGTEFPIDIDLIERIEIIRGPVSSLYGSNALFAVINIVTRRGQDLKGLEASGEAGSFNTYQGRFTYGNEVHQVDFLLSGTFYGSRGHKRLFFSEFNAPETNNGIASHADDGQAGSSLVTVSYKGFTLQGVYGNREKGIPTAAYETIFNTPHTRTTDTHGYVDLRYEHTFAGSWDLLARTFYDRYTYSGTYMYSSEIDPEQITPNLDFADGKWWGTELQVTKTVLSRNRVTVGGEYRDNIRQDQHNFNVNPYSLLLDDRRHSFAGAVYVQDELTIAKSLALNAGFRYDYYSDVQGNLDPRAALIYRPRSQTALKFIYGEAFRTPNVYERYYSIPPNLPNPSLKPEKIRSTEFVWEQGLKNHLWFSTSAFYNVIDGLITEEPTGDDLLIFRNLQNARSAGVEFEVKGQLAGGLEGGASYSFQQTKDRQTGQFLSNSPRNLITLNLTQPFLRKRLFASLDAQYRSRIQPLSGPPVSPFALVNLTLFGRNIGRHVDVSTSVYNLLDKSYFDPPSAENLRQPIQQDGRSFRVKLTWHPGER